MIISKLIPVKEQMDLFFESDTEAYQLRSVSMIVCPVCGKDEDDNLAPGDTQVYECDSCGESFIAEYTDDGILYDGFIGA